MSSILQPAKHVIFFMRPHARIEGHTQHYLYYVDSEEVHSLVITGADSMSYLPPRPMFDTNMNNRTCLCAIHLRGLSFAQHLIKNSQARGNTCEDEIKGQ